MHIPELKCSLKAENLGKRFRKEWIFRNFNFEFKAGNRYAITGPNGSGKSTLLQLLWGQTLPTTGTVNYTFSNKPLIVEKLFEHVTITAPYLDVIEELTLIELLKFHFKLRKAVNNYSIDEIMATLELEHAAQKAVVFFSSGMKQRLKLGLAVLTQHSFLFLDEPFTNLDEASCLWAKKLLEKHPSEITCIASNDKREFEQANEVINLKHYKS
ncbi:MAG: ATP-binding cassette domain-containing protein [Cyclobacteriaceae bacterium]|jgi:ABC-type multidrug transport system ATPase subunit|nr:ATP-binding cassette domain-containing protein [Cyclobacteriaceae bacterium]